jgi:hypothetical protein
MSTANGSFSAERTLSMFFPSNIVSVAGVESAKNISLAQDIDFSFSGERAKSTIIRYCGLNQIIMRLLTI